MSTPRLPDYLQHIRLAAHQAETYIEGVELDEFLQNDFVQNAVHEITHAVGVVVPVFSSYLGHKHLSFKSISQP